MDVLKVFKASALSTEAGSGTREGIPGAVGCLRSNPIPAGAAARAAFHNSGGFVSEEGRAKQNSSQGRGHQRRRAASKATQSRGVDDCSPPFTPLLATSKHLISPAHARAQGGGEGGGWRGFMQLRRAGTFDSHDLVVCVGSHRFGRSIMGCGLKKNTRCLGERAVVCPHGVRRLRWLCCYFALTNSRWL